MKAFRLIPICMMLLIGVASCGESAKERQAREAAEAQHIADSIAQVEAEAKAKAEQKRQDSIASALKRAEQLAADSALRAQLLPAFKEEKNADASGASLYRVKTAPQSHLSNYAYLTFSVDNGTAREMFINVCYCGNDWINIERAEIVIDNDNYEDISVSTDQVSNKVNSNLSCSEWFTVPVYSSVLDRLIEAKSVRIKLTGSDRSKDIALSKQQLADMHKTIRLFRAFGG